MKYGIKLDQMIKQFVTMNITHKNVSFHKTKQNPIKFFIVDNSLTLDCDVTATLMA